MITIFEAAAEGDLDFLKKNVRILTEKNERGWTVLHFAARFGQLPIAQYLKQEAKLDLTVTNGEGKTASEVASFWGYDDIAKLIAPPVVEKEAPQDASTFPDNYTAVFAGNPLNRFGWNRSKSDFLAEMAHAPSSKYIVMNKGMALYNEAKDDGSLHYLSYNDVSAFVDLVYSNDGNAPENEYDVTLIFLGMDESNTLNSVAFWALDVTAKRGPLKEKYEAFQKEIVTDDIQFSNTLPRAFIMDKPTGAIIAQAASLIDWNSRNVYCPACGNKTKMEEAGYKRSCPAEQTETCISHTGVQNFSYPRTDAVAIMCIIHPSGEKILLGRNKRWPKKMYSCISGFVEPAETLEEAVRREALEETGVVVNRVAYHSSQPWPFPNSLMLGFIAEAVSTDITFADDELESAEWFTRAEVTAALKNEPNAKFSMAPKGSLASTLVHAWIEDKKWQNITHAKM